MSPALLFGGGALVVLAVILAVVFGSGKDDGDTSTVKVGGPSDVAGNTPSATNKPDDTIASLKAELRETNLRAPSEYKGYAERFLRVGGEDGKTEAKRLYQEMIDQVAPDDLEARKFLGFTDFQSDILTPGSVLGEYEEPIPDSIANRRGYPFLDAVVQFNNIRWLDDEDDIRLAKQAVKEMKAHEKKLQSDHQYRAADGIRANIATNTLLSPYNYETRWTAPYLIVFSSKDRLSEFDLLQEPDRKERRRMRAKMNEKREKWERVLDEKEKLYSQLYKEWMKQYGERFDLKDLSAEYGGRPDYGSYNTFADGVPLVIWIFEDREAFQDYHNNVKGESIPDFAAGYFSPATSWIFLYDEEESNSDRVFEINKNLHEGAHQLQHWFTRQRNRWKEPHFAQTSFSEGLAEYLGSVEMDKHRNLKWTYVNQSRLRNMQGFAKQLERRDQEYYLMPVERLMWTSTYGAIMQWGANKWGINPQVVMSLFYQQSWALTYFMNTFEGGKYRDQWFEYFDAVLGRETGMGRGLDVFKRIFRIRDEEDWEDIEEEWKTFVNDKLLKMKVPEYTPPKRTDWPDDE